MTQKTSVFSRINKQLPLNLREKITIPYLFLGTLLVIAAVFIITRVVFDTVEERFSNQLVEAGILASERMVVEEKNLLRSMRTIAFTQGVPEALAEKDPEKLRTLTFGEIANTRLDHVVFLDLEGGLVFSALHVEGGNVEEYKFSTGDGTLFYQQPFVQAVINQTSDNKGNKFAGYIHIQQTPYFYVSGPVYDENSTMIGVLLIGSSMKELVQQIREETLAQISIYDLQGNTLATTLPISNTLDKETVDMIISLQDETALMQSGSRYLDVRNIEYRELFTPWEVRGWEDFGVMGVALRESFLVTTTNTTRFQIAIFGVLFFVLIAAIGINLSYFITRPLSELVSATKKAMSGDLNVSVSPSSKDELAVMANSFNRMISSIRESKERIIESYDSTLEGWSKALELRDKETKGHSIRVLKMMEDISRRLEIDEEKIVHIRRGTLLHDIGKIGIPDSILGKPGKLTEEETAMMHNHPLYAYELLKDIEFLQPALAIPLYHHEWWDGSGYPWGLKGEEIPQEARLFALVDVWDAITNDRTYHKAWSKEAAIKKIKDGVGTHFDPAITQVFLEYINGK